MSNTAGTALRNARTRAGLTQNELANRAGVAQSVISAYESGRRQPSLPMLMSLVTATGFELQLNLATPVDRLTGPIGRRVQQNRERIRQLAAHYGVIDVRVFGSVARGEDREDSDLDLLVELPEDAGLLTMGRLSGALEDLLQVRVDIVPEAGVKTEVRQRIDADLIAL